MENQPFQRKLSTEDEHQLLTFWAPALGISTTAEQLRELAERICRVESVCVGRLAGDIQDAVLRVLIASAVKSDTLNILEIGVLFGVNAIAMYDASARRFPKVRMVLIDPLNGYYHPGEPDILTGEQISKENLIKNLCAAQVPDEHVEIFQNYSDHPTVRRSISSKRFNFIFIDGDHSFDGIKKDFIIYSPLIEDGGYLVIDNYKDGVFPDVDRFIDTEMMKSPLFECVGVGWRTVAFRKIKTRNLSDALSRSFNLREN